MGRHSAKGRRSSVDLRRARVHVPLWQALDAAGHVAFQRLTWLVLGICAMGFLAGLGMFHLGAPGGYAGAALGAVLTALACRSSLRGTATVRRGDGDAATA